MSHDNKRATTLRSRSEAARVSNEELFFDLVYAFSVTQLSHYLLDHLTLLGALQTLVMGFAVWLGWQYTAWTTNWFNPGTLRIRGVLFAIMLLAMVMASALPGAFAERGLVFALCFVGIQAGRTLCMLIAIGPNDPLTPNFRRLLAWNCVAGVFWIAGGFAQGEARLALWLGGVLCEYIAPMIGLRFPGLGRSLTSDWTIDGGHLAERCQLFVIVALGESVLATGIAFGHHAEWHGPDLFALMVGFSGSLAMWWMYFDIVSIGAEKYLAKLGGTDRADLASDAYTYLHFTLVAGVIISALGVENVLAHLDSEHGLELFGSVALFGGTSLYLAGHAFFWRRVAHRWLPSRLIGAAVLLALIPVGAALPSLAAIALATGVTAAVVAVETLTYSRERAAVRSGG